MASKKVERRLRQQVARYETADSIDRMSDRQFRTKPLTRRERKIKNLNGRANATLEAKVERNDLSHHDDKASIERSKYLLKNVIQPNEHPFKPVWRKPT